MPATYTQDNEETRSIDVVHIEPSIREGFFLMSSLYGKDSAQPLTRFGPVNITAPFITGSGVIPGRLVCEIGSWSASPTSDYYYQWMWDGVDIPGANAYEIFTDETFDGRRLTCEVRADNGIGEAYAITSNFVDCSLIEPIEARELEFFGVTGLRANKNQTMLAEQEFILSGMGTDNRLDVMRGVSYYLTGIGTEDRQDVNAMPIFSITGLNQQDTLSVLERTLGVAVISLENGRPLEDGVPQAIPLKGGNAELGLLGWTALGGITVQSGGSDILTTGIEGEQGWHGGFNVDPANNNTPYTNCYQDVPLWDIWHADIDAGLCYLDTSFVQAGYAAAEVEDTANVRVEFYDGLDNLIGSNPGPGFLRIPNVSIWFTRSFETPIPSGTRTVRVFLEWLWDPINGDNHMDAFLDAVNPKIRKGNKVSGLDYGPNMQYWRLRFTQQTSWSGGAFSELEFPSVFGGADLANGGSILFGSAGLGVTNADAAFDGILSNYWAGAENSITEGTAWVGYNFGSTLRPESVRITARPGADALQVGGAFVVEASEDGLQWVEFEQYDIERVARTWNAGETREFHIHNGALPYMYDSLGSFPNPTFGYTTNSGDDYNTKGMAYKNSARTVITHLRFGVMNQTHNFRWQIAKLEDSSNSSWYFGRISELLHDGVVAYTEIGAPSDAMSWVEVALPQPVYLEPGENFVIVYQDHELDINPNTVVTGDTTQGRLRWITDYNGADTSDRRPFLRIRDGWQMNRAELYALADINDGPFQSGTGYHHAIDFRGNFY